MFHLKDDLEKMEINNKKVNWEPKEDITSYEVAMCIPLLLLGIEGRVNELHENLDKLPDNARRHFLIE